MRYAYPFYRTELTPEVLQECVKIAIQLLDDAGILVRHHKFREALKGKKGVKIEGERIKLDRSIVQQNLETILAKKRKELLVQKERRKSDAEWKISTGGFSMAVIDIETDNIRMATCQDLKDLIRLMDSYGIGGYYPVMPQDIPPIMQAIACFKICWENSDKVQPYDYQNISQTDYIYEMHKVMAKTFTVSLTVTKTMTLGEEDLEVFFKFYPEWKKGANINFSILDYPMLGISKPITATGCITQYLADMLGVYTLFNLFDSQLEMPVGFNCGAPTDLRSVCWAFGHPRKHLFNFLNSQLLSNLLQVEDREYHCASVLLESSSCAIDEQAALEKMAVALTGAFQGARCFSYAGNLAVDDLFSGVQFVIDVEIVNYIKELIEAFNPHPDIVSMEGIYELLKDVSLGKEEFISHPDTAKKVRNIVPSSNLLCRQKLRQWLGNEKSLKDRAREECFQRLREHKQNFQLPLEKQKVLDEIYEKAESHLTGK